jgi:hypothetical protein
MSKDKRKAKVRKWKNCQFKMKLIWECKSNFWTKPETVHHLIVSDRKLERDSRGFIGNNANSSNQFKNFRHRRWNFFRCFWMTNWIYVWGWKYSHSFTKILLSNLHFHILFQSWSWSWSWSELLSKFQFVPFFLIEDIRRQIALK